MQLCGSWNIDTITQNATFDWDVIPFPASPRTGMATPILSVIPYSVNARSKHLDEAVTFALWSMGEDAATILARNGQGIPTQAEIAPIFFETVPAEHKLVYLDVANARGDWEVVRTVPTGEWHDQTVNNITQFVFWDAEEYSVEEALKKVCVEMNAIFDLYD
jgi:multiple sugar transport system substrate-binding protein